jgi:hypothetical protein
MQGWQIKEGTPFGKKRKISQIIKLTFAYCYLCYAVYGVNYSISHRATGQDSTKMYTI